MRYIEKSVNDPLVIEAQFILSSIMHYNDSDRVKDIIRTLYYGCCAFCGSYPEHSSFYQIEHFYPKGTARYSHYVKDIFNLHYVCQRCNTLKRNQVHLNIFSPNTFLQNNKWNHGSSKKIEAELVYIGHILYSVNNRPGSIDRAEATIKLFDLNNDNDSSRSGRQHLVEERIRIFDSVFQLINTIYHLLKEERSSTYNDQAIKLLFGMVIRYLSPQSPYSNMIAQNFGDDIFKLLSVFIKSRRSLLT